MECVYRIKIYEIEVKTARLYERLEHGGYDDEGPIYIQARAIAWENFQCNILCFVCSRYCHVLEMLPHR